MAEIAWYSFISARLFWSYFFFAFRTFEFEHHRGLRPGVFFLRFDQVTCFARSMFEWLWFSLFLPVSESLAMITAIFILKNILITVWTMFQIAISAVIFLKLINSIAFFASLSLWFSCISQDTVFTKSIVIQSGLKHTFLTRFLRSAFLWLTPWF